MVIRGITFILLFVNIYCYAQNEQDKSFIYFSDKYLSVNKCFKDSSEIISININQKKINLDTIHFSQQTEFGPYYEYVRNRDKGDSLVIRPYVIGKKTLLINIFNYSYNRNVLYIIDITANKLISRDELTNNFFVKGNHLIYFRVDSSDKYDGEIFYLYVSRISLLNNKRSNKKIKIKDINAFDKFTFDAEQKHDLECVKNVLKLYGNS